MHPGVSFERVDVDHVVLAGTGVYAVEVKGLSGRRETLADTYGLREKVEQARRGARKVELLLASCGCTLPVRPVLVLAGPGSSTLDGAVDLEGVLVVAHRNSTTWRRAMARPGSALDLTTTAGDAAQQLLAYDARRRDHRLPAQRRRHPGVTAPTRQDHLTSPPPG